MSDLLYLKITGEKQGNISSGCGTYESVGNRWQVSHEDGVFVFSLVNTVTSTCNGLNLQGLNFCKLIDKNTPRFCNAITQNERLYIEIDFYRINNQGRWEHYYYIQLRNASVANIHTNFTHNNLDTESITVTYEYIVCKHLIANTEFDYLAFPADYNGMFIPHQIAPACRVVTNSGMKKNCGRKRWRGVPPQPGGVFSGGMIFTAGRRFMACIPVKERRMKMFAWRTCCGTRRRSVINLLPLPDVTDFNDDILVFPANSGIKPIYVYLKDEPRKQPGVVTGKGVELSPGTRWLDMSVTNQGNGAPIPAHIADKLRGMKFKNFDDFREALWLEVSKDPVLME